MKINARLEYHSESLSWSFMDKIKNFSIEIQSIDAITIYLDSFTGFSIDVAGEEENVLSFMTSVGAHFVERGLYRYGF